MIQIIEKIFFKRDAPITDRRIVSTDAQTIFREIAREAARKAAEAALRGEI